MNVGQRNVLAKVLSTSTRLATVVCLLVAMTTMSMAQSTLQAIAADDDAQSGSQSVGAILQ
ncbi:MAG: hypothetical protein M3Y72_22195, partial [Acidobacteriota bacterium]|nr:hypothetical protein [Acidobacteriota bacterium]